MPGRRCEHYPPSGRPKGQTKVASRRNGLATSRSLQQTSEAVSGEMGLDRGGRIISPEFGFTGWAMALWRDRNRRRFYMVVAGSEPIMTRARLWDR